MSVWRIKDVDEATRERAKAAADKAGMPLAAWIELAIMRRVAHSTVRAASPQPVAAEQAPSAAPAEPVSPPAGETEVDEKMQQALEAAQRRRKRKRKRAKAEPQDVAAADAAVAAPVVDADAGSSADAPDAAPIEPHFEQPPSPSDMPQAAADAAAEPTEIVEPSLEQYAADVPAPLADPQITTTPREVLLAHATRRDRSAARRVSPMAAIGAGVAGIAVVAAIGYFLFQPADDQDLAPAPSAAASPQVATASPSGAATPAPVPSAPVAVPAPATANRAPAPAAASTPPSAPTAQPSPPPQPTQPTQQAANTPPIPAAKPGEQPSLLVPVPNAPPPTATDADQPVRPGPVVAQHDTLPHLISRAEAGDIEAQLELGKRYMQGSGSAQNAPEALRWLLKAAEAGNPQAQFNVGVMYERGIGTTIDPVKAVEWYRKAAAQPIPVPTAIHNLALLYINGGGGIAPDPVQARALMIRAAELGQPESQYSLGLMYFQGVGGGGPDRITALSWLALAARSNQPQYIQAATELANAMSADEKSKAQQLANQHITRINQNIARLRSLANAGTASGAPGDGGSAGTANKPLDRAGIMEMQKLLAALKLYGGAADGADGPKTQQAIRDYQTMAGLPVDGKATTELLASLREVAGAVK